MLDLLLLRHGETMQSAADGSDHARPLSTHGELQARDAGRWLRDHGAHPDHVLCSTAARAMMTAEHALRELNGPAPAYLRTIYEATPGDLIGVLEDCTDARQILLVGHNPGLEHLVALLVEGRSQAFRGMPPAAVAWLRLDGPLEPGAARLHAFWSP